MANPYPITAHDVLEAIKQGAREGTAQAMAEMFETGSAKVQLTGRKVTETLISRAVRTETVQIVLSPPDWARGAVFVLRMYGATGSFASEEGARLIVVQKTSPTTSGSQTIAVSTFEATTASAGHQTLWIHPGANTVDMEPAGGRQIKSVSVDLRGGIWTAGIAVSGTFSAGQGIDAEVFVTWLD